MRDFNITFAKAFMTAFCNKCKLKALKKEPNCFKAGLSPSKKKRFLFASMIKMMKNVFYFILKALFVLNISKFLSWIFGCVEKTA